MSYGVRSSKTWLTEGGMTFGVQTRRTAWSQQSSEEGRLCV